MSLYIATSPFVIKDDQLLYFDDRLSEVLMPYVERCSVFILTDGDVRAYPRHVEELKTRDKKVIIVRNDEMDRYATELRDITNDEVQALEKEHKDKKVILIGFRFTDLCRERLSVQDRLKQIEYELIHFNG